MGSLSSYRALGAILLLAGAIAAPVFYLVAASIPLTALALSSVLLGVIALLLDRSLPHVPPRAAEALLAAGLENLAALLEELGVGTAAVYIPSALAGGRPRALIPLHGSPPPRLERALDARLIVEFGSGPEDVGILVATPGSAVAGLLEAPPGPASSELEAALTRILVGALDVARSVQVAQEGGTVTVRIGGGRLDRGASRTDRVLGSPVASVAATVVAEGLGRPVSVAAESRSDGTVVVSLEVAG